MVCLVFQDGYPVRQYETTEDHRDELSVVLGSAIRASVATVFEAHWGVKYHQARQSGVPFRY